MFTPPLDWKEQVSSVFNDMRTRYYSLAIMICRSGVALRLAQTWIQTFTGKILTYWRLINVIDTAAVSSDMTGRLQQEMMLRKVVLVILVCFYTYWDRPHHEAVKSVQRVANIRSIDIN
jgi:hypothetical protein